MSLSPYQWRFQIRDLEEFSGVKAHTIRIWEKRYGLLRPDRTDTNIRTYGLEELKALLNVAYLNQHGKKISAIAKLSLAEREQLVREMSVVQKDLDGALNTLKMAMLSFDEALFDGTCARFRAKEGFRALVEKLFLPLLEHIGMLWQTNSICPSHEHFVSNLVRQKLCAEVDAIPPPAIGQGPLTVLYLPESEIHELGLLYVLYLLRASGKPTVYLGQSVPMDDLAQLAALTNGPLRYISFITAFPSAEHLPVYAKGLTNLLPMDRATIWFCGSQVGRAGDVRWPAGVHAFRHVRDLLAELDRTTA